MNQLAALGKRLSDIASILHEMSHDDTQAAIASIVKAARKGGGKAVRSAARRCSSLAEQRFRKRLRALEKALKEHGWTAKCWTRPVDESDSVYWPPMEVAVLVEIADFETDVHYIENCLLVGQEQLGQDWPFRVVPVINGQLVSTLALLPSSQMPLSDQKFAQKWKSHIDLPFLSPETSEAFDAALTACTQISAIINCRDLTNLHPEEDDVFSKAIEAFEDNRKIVAANAEKTGLEQFGLALAFLDESWHQVVSEFEAANAGQTADNPVCMNSYRAIAGEENEWVSELAAARMLLPQAECHMAAI